MNALFQISKPNQSVKDYQEKKQDIGKFVEEKEAKQNNLQNKSSKTLGNRTKTLEKFKLQ